jgi:hypothetical protein
VLNDETETVAIPAASVTEVSDGQGIVVYWRDIDSYSRHRPDALIIARESSTKGGSA